MLDFIQNPWVIGIVGGIVCGKVYGRISPLWLRRLFGLLLLYGGLRSLFAS